jgi:hypothetical protein
MAQSQQIIVVFEQLYGWYKQVSGNFKRRRLQLNHKIKDDKAY